MMTKRIQAFPTFHFYIGGRLVEEMRGADARRLESLVQTHMAAAGPGVFGGTGLQLIIFTFSI